MSWVRYLTTLEKYHRLHFSFRFGVPRDSRSLGVGMGSWLARFNKLEGVCVVQCSVGNPDRGDLMGFLGLRMSKRMHLAFEAESLSRLSRKGWFYDAYVSYVFTRMGFVRPQFVLLFDARRSEEALSDIFAEVRTLITAQSVGSDWKF